MRQYFKDKETLVACVEDLLKNSEPNSVLIMIIAPGQFGDFSASIVTDASSGDIVETKERIYSKPPTST